MDYKVSSALLLLFFFFGAGLTQAEIATTDKEETVSLLHFIEEAVSLFHPDRALFQKLKNTPEPEASTPAEGTMKLNGHSYTWSHTAMRKQLKKSGKPNSGWIKHKQLVAVTRAGLDEQPQFVNAFLLGFSPFPISHPDDARKALAYHMKYVRDEVQFKKEEVYLSSIEAFRLKQGDCEDHAILLADWLITEGYDARVVIGKREDEGHVWVALFWNDEIYNIESTKKTVTPLRKAESFKTFIPRYMFNRTTLWSYIGEKEKNDYSPSAWKQTAQFSVGSQKLPSKKTPLVKRTPNVATAAQQQKSTQKQSGSARIIARTKLIDRPAYVARPLRNLHAGESITIIQKQKQWYKVRTKDGDTGYVLSQDIQ